MHYGKKLHRYETSCTYCHPLETLARESCGEDYYDYQKQTPQRTSLGSLTQLGIAAEKQGKRRRSKTNRHSQGERVLETGRRPPLIQRCTLLKPVFKGLGEPMGAQPSIGKWRKKKSQEQDPRLEPEAKSPKALRDLHSSRTLKS